jgi:adenylate kinase family enzyme
LVSLAEGIPSLPPRRIHIFGASGSGTTTLGGALAERLGITHLDTDHFFWLPTDPPYTAQRPVPERIALLRAAMDAAPDGWTLSGSLVRWGDSFIPDFDLAVFVFTDPAMRLPRLIERERARYGAAIEPGGSMHAQSLEFIEWARSYDRPDFDGRSLVMHRAWLARLPCPVIELDGAAELGANVDRVLSAS